MMEKGSPASPNWSWDEMLSAFRALGGIVQNVRPGRGQYGRGLFAADPAQPVLVRIPPNLLFPVKDVEFVSGAIRIKDTATVPEAERIFFERYQNGFSWGATGQSESIAHVTALDSLPAEIRELLTAEFWFGGQLQGDFAGRVQNHFLRSREITWQDGLAIMPVIELANHGPEGFSYDKGADLRIQGRVRDEVLVRYGPYDAYSIFYSFGFVSRQPAAYSLPTGAKIEDMEINIGRNMGGAVRRGKVRFPKMRVEGRRVELSYVLLGHREFPGLPRGTFRTLMSEAGMENPDEAFDDIVRLNALKFIRLLKALEPYAGEMILALRRMARFQLETMAHCIGSRAFDPMAVPIGQTWTIPAR